MTYIPVGSQNDVIASTGPAVIVLGGAGTGKTTTATAAALAHLRRADERHTAIRRAAMIDGRRVRLPTRARVLFLSFSRTAVSQIVDRASAVTATYLPRLDVSTFHGFAWRVIADFGAHHGYPPPLSITSPASSRLPDKPPGLIYDELIPAAITVLQVPAVAAHYNARYTLIICDEFQDTSDLEWRFLQLIATDARRMFLGDVNQCIYSGLKRIKPELRIAQAMAIHGAVSIPLPPASHRDPTGVLPAAADAARRRAFGHDAIRQAVTTGRLAVTRASADTCHDKIIDLVRQTRETTTHCQRVHPHQRRDPVCQGELRPVARSKSVWQGEFRIEKR